MKINERREVFLVKIRKRKYFGYFKQNRKQLKQRSFSQNLNKDYLNYLDLMKSKMATRLKIFILTQR